MVPPNAILKTLKTRKEKKLKNERFKMKAGYQVWYQTVPQTIVVQNHRHKISGLSSCV